MKIYKTLNEAYPVLIKDVLENGKECAPRGKPIKELLGYQFKLESIEDSLPLQKSRKLNYKWAVLEGLFNVAGIYPTDLIEHYAKFMLPFQNKKTGTWDGAYAPRIAGALRSVYELLANDPDTRQAIIPIFKTSDAVNAQTSLDVPCTISLQFLYRDGRLNLIANMRSNDVFWGTAYDINQFTTVQRALASWLGCPAGWYIHQAGSFHIYLNSVDQMRAVVEAGTEEQYADFQHPVWPSLTQEQTSLGLSVLFQCLRNEIKGNIDTFLSPPQYPFNIYLSYLTGTKHINYASR